MESVYLTLFLDALKLRNFHIVVKNVAMVDALEYVCSAGGMRVSASFRCIIIFCVRLLHVCPFNYDGQCEGLKAWNGQRYGSHALFFISFVPEQESPKVD